MVRPVFAALALAGVSVILTVGTVAITSSHGVHYLTTDTSRFHVKPSSPNHKDNYTVILESPAYTPLARIAIPYDQFKPNTSESTTAMKKLIWKELMQQRFIPLAYAVLAPLVSAIFIISTVTQTPVMQRVSRKKFSWYSLLVFVLLACSRRAVQ